MVLLALEWILPYFPTGAHTRGWFVGRASAVAPVSTEQVRLVKLEGDYQQVEKLMSKTPITPNNRRELSRWLLKQLNSVVTRPVQISIWSARIGDGVRQPDPG